MRMTITHLESAMDSVERPPTHPGKNTLCIHYCLWYCLAHAYLLERAKLARFRPCPFRSHGDEHLKLSRPFRGLRKRLAQTKGAMLPGGLRTRGGVVSVHEGGVKEGTYHGDGTKVAGLFISLR